MPIPKPRENESEDAFISRCISFLINEGYEPEQAKGIAFSQWRDSKKGAAHELRFITSIHQLEAGPEGNLATFYLMNTSRNRNRWGVTKQALEEALPTIVRVSLGCGPGYKIDKHYASPMKVGSFLKGKMPNGYALGTAKVEDELVWGNLKAGKWGPISVVITSYREVCSKCGQSLIGERNPWEHDCIAKDDAYIQVHSFKFKHVDLVDIPAYPQAGLQDFGGAVEGLVSIPLELCAGIYTSQSITDGLPGALGNQNSPDRKELKKMTPEEIEQLQAKVTELQGSVDTLTASVTTLNDEKKTLTKDKETLEAKVETLENPEENPEIKVLNDKLAAIEAERHQEVLDACVEARFKAGLTSDKAKELTALKDFSDEMLKFMTLEAAKVEEMREESEPGKPKSKYTDQGGTDLDAALTKQRAAYGFPPRVLEAAN